MRLAGPAAQPLSPTSVDKILGKCRREDKNQVLPPKHYHYDSWGTFPNSRFPSNHITDQFFQLFIVFGERCRVSSVIRGTRTPIMPLTLHLQNSHGKVHPECMRQYHYNWIMGTWPPALFPRKERSDFLLCNSTTRLRGRDEEAGYQEYSEISRSACYSDYYALCTHTKLS